MNHTHSSIDPYHASDGYYECSDCGRRQSGGERPTVCPACGGEVHNIAVPRE